MPPNLYRRGGTWYARFKIRGHESRVSLRTGDLREARLRLKGLRRKAERSLYGIEAAKTWEDAVVAYAAGVLDAGSLKPSTAKRYRTSLRQIDLYFRGKALPTITQSIIAGYVSKRQKAGATNATIRRDLTTISRVLAHAKQNGMLDGIFVEQFDRSSVRERRAPISAPSDETVDAVISAISLSHPALAALARFLRGTGMRSGEALRARWADLRGDELTITETKNGRVRTIVIEQKILPPRTGERLFPSLPEESTLVSSLWKWARHALPPEQRFHLHALRHAYAIAEIRAGRDIYDLSRHLGHSSVAVTEIYLGYRPAGRKTGGGTK